LQWKKCELGERSFQNRWGAGASMYGHMHEAFFEHLMLLKGKLVLNLDKQSPITLSTESPFYTIPPGVGHSAHCLEHVEFIVKFDECQSQTN